MTATHFAARACRRRALRAACCCVWLACTTECASGEKPAAAVAAVLPAHTDAWSRFGVGSAVVYQFVQPTPDFDMRVTRGKIELLADATGAPARIQISEQRHNDYVPTFEQRFGNALRFQDMTPAPGDQQVLTIVGRRMRCTVTTYESSTPDAGDIKCIVWTTPDLEVPFRVLEAPGRIRIGLPSNVVRMDYVNSHADHLASVGVQIVQIDAPQHIAGTALPCIVEQHDGLDMRAGRRDRILTREWLSAEVPGHLVRREHTLTRSTTSTKHIVNVVSYTRP